MDGIRDIRCTVHCKCSKCGKEESIPECCISVARGIDAGGRPRASEYLSVVGRTVGVKVVNGENVCTDRFYNEWKSPTDCGCEPEHEFTKTLLEFNEWLQGGVMTAQALTIGGLLSGSGSSVANVNAIRQYTAEFLKATGRL